MKDEEEIVVHKKNRIHSKTDTSRGGWCHGCDAAKPREGQRCPVCGSVWNKKKLKGFGLTETKGIEMKDEERIEKKLDILFDFMMEAINVFSPNGMMLKMKYEQLMESIRKESR